MLRKIKSVGIIGMGAVGAVVGEQLHSVLGNNLYCIMDLDRKTKYSESGIYINNRKIDFNYVLPSESKICDLIIIATKNLQLQEAFNNIKDFVEPDTVILSLLNGIQSERDIEAAFGNNSCLYGFIIDLQSINLSGNISCSGKACIVFGEKNNCESDRVLAVKALFEDCGIKYKASQDIQLDMWKKFLINTMFNSLAAITRSTYGGFKFDCMQDASRKIGYEVVKIANAEGIALTTAMIEEDIAKNLSYDPKSKCSMLQDMEAGRNTENDFFCGTIVKLGKKHNIPTPYCEFLWDLLKGSELVRQI